VKVKTEGATVARVVSNAGDTPVEETSIAIPRTIPFMSALR
jgi:hypothetical protein